MRKIDRTGETGIANNGMRMVIKVYRNADDIDVQFEDGTVVEHKSHSKFKHGAIAHPNTNTRNAQTAQKRIGETVYARNGMKMSIIKYRAKHDIDVQFEDGTIVTQVAYNNFVNRSIKHPTKNYWANIHARRVGEIGVNNLGIEMTIIKYTSAVDLDVQFADQTIVKHKAYNAFRRGDIKYEFPTNIGNIQISQLAYVYAGTCNFYCSCTKCGLHDILTIEEMKSHKCIAK